MNKNKCLAHKPAFVFTSLLLLSCSPEQDDVNGDSRIRIEVARMASDFLGLREMQGFPYDMSLDEAYRWQDEFVANMQPALGEVAGYKTGGHDPGPGFPVFPPQGIRATILQGMIHQSGTAIRLEQTVWGFLEADFAFRVGDASINTAVTDLETLAGLDAIIPFAEIPDPFYEQGTRTINGTVVANMSSRFAFVGEAVALEPTAEWIERINTITFAVFDEHGNEIGSGTMDGYYEPLKVVRWLRDQLRRSGKELRPGHILSLGNIGIIRQIHPDTPSGGAPYESNQFRLEYFGLRDDGPATVVINLDR